MKYVWEWITYEITGKMKERQNEWEGEVLMK